MPKIFNIGNHNFKDPNECVDKNPIQASLNERTDRHCVENELDECQEQGRKKKWGFKANCDPMQAGKIINDISTEPNRSYIYRYSNALRGAEQAMQALFKDLVVIDENGKPHPIPLYHGSQERCVAWMFENVRKDNTLVVDRPMLPLMAINCLSIEPDQTRYIYHKAKIRLKRQNNENVTADELLERDTMFGVASGIPVNLGYKLYAWTYYQEDMNQIIEQVMQKIYPMTYISIVGVPWAVTVRFDSVDSKITEEPGDKAERLFKYDFSMTAESYIPQPIVRNKTVLKIVTDFHNSTNPNEITDVYGRTEIQ